MSRLGYTTPYRADPRDAVGLVAQVAAILSIGAGVIHVSAAGDHTNLPVMLVGFIVVAALQVAFGALLLWRRPSKLLILAGLALMLGSIGVWLVSRTAGLPFLEDGHTEPVGFKDGVTVLFEVASVPMLLLLLSRDLARVSLPSPRLAGHTLTALGATCFALMMPALLLGGGEHHTHEEAVEMGIHEDDHPAGDELAHAEPDSHGPAGDGHRAADHENGGKRGHRHDDSGGEHDHSGTELASAPLGRGHEHDGDTSPGDEPRHHADEDEGSVHRDHDRRRGRPDRDHGHGNHGDEEPGGESGDEPPITVTYEPEPSVCLAPGGATFCVP